LPAAAENVGSADPAAVGVAAAVAVGLTVGVLDDPGTVTALDTVGDSTGARYRVGLAVSVGAGVTGVGSVDELPQPANATAIVKTTTPRAADPTS
jgi:hypothetical protein